MNPSSAEYNTAAAGGMYMIVASIGGPNVEIVHTSTSSTRAIAVWTGLMETRTWNQVGNHNLYVADIAYEVFRVEPNGKRETLIGSSRRERKRLVDHVPIPVCVC